jgi:hypothetical protein
VAVRFRLAKKRDTPLPVPQHLVDETGAKGTHASAAGDGWCLGALVLVTASGLSLADRAGFAQT